MVRNDLGKDLGHNLGRRQTSCPRLLPRSLPRVCCMRCIACHTISMLVVACRSAALAVEQEAPVREGVVGETVGFPTLQRK